MAGENDRSTSRIHWLVAARFSAEPRGESFRCAADGLDAAVGGRVGSLRVEVPDRVGAGATRALELPIRSLRSFTYAGVVEAVPQLKELRAVAQRASATPAQLVADVERIAGPGRLLSACRAAADAASQPPAPPAPAAQRAVDAFVGATVTPAGGASAAKQVRALVDAAAIGTARDALSAEPVRTLEASWRGLRMLLAACPAGADMDVELLDAGPAQVAELVRARPPSEAFEDPDALFVAEPVASAELLAGLAEVAEEMLAPAVVEVAVEALGASDTADLAARAGKGERPPGEWQALRELEHARWLCATVNRVAVFAEGGGAFQRAAFASPVWATAAMLAASYRGQGAFAGAVGKRGALAAPAAWVLPAGPQRGSLAPTEAFLAIAAQDALSGLGVVGLGSVLDSDRVVLVAAPTAASAPDAAPLPAQLLIGRIVRFARWATQQIDPALPPDQVTALFQQAAGLFLSPGMAGAVALGAKVEGEGEARALRVAARVDASHAGVPLVVEFALSFRA